MINREFTEWITKLFPFENGRYYADNVDKQYVSDVVNLTMTKANYVRLDGDKRYYYIDVSLSKDSLNIEFGDTKRLFIRNHGNNNYVYTLNHGWYAKRFKIVIFDEFPYQYNYKTQKLFPMTLKSLCFFIYHPYFFDFLQGYLAYLAQKRPIFKDILK